MTHAEREDIDFKELVLALWQSKWFILLTTGLITLAVGVTAWRLPKKYEASIVVSTTKDGLGGQFGSMNSLASGLGGGLASLAGLSMGDSKQSESVAVLESGSLSRSYIEKNNLIPILYSDRWDAVHKTWKDQDKKKAPTLWMANQLFTKEVRKIKVDPKTGLITLTVIWTDPRAASSWANDLVKLANDYLRSKAIAESERNIAYLSEEAEKTTIVGVKQAIYAVLQTEINRAMFARGNEEYAFKILDPAIQPEFPASPRKLRWLIAGFMAGLFLSTTLVLLRTAWKR